MSPKEDLEERIRASHKLITEYEAIVQVSGDPREQARSRRAIKEQQDFIKKQLEPYRRLLQRGNAVAPSDIGEIADLLGFELPIEPPPLPPLPIDPPPPPPTPPLPPSLSTCTHLAISLHPREGGTYAITMRYRFPGEERTVEPLAGTPMLVQFDERAQRGHGFDAQRYGEWLTHSLFANEAIRRGFDRAYTGTFAANASTSCLRVQLHIATDAPELHLLRWETLRNPDPNEATRLTTSERIYFSRYLDIARQVEVEPPARAAMHALVAIANPINISDETPGGQQLEPVPVAQEYQQAIESLGTIRRTTLASRLPEAAGAPTLNNLVAQLRDGCDILYLVAHGAMLAGEPRIWLEASDGTADAVTVDTFIERLRELQRLPRLAILISCQSAGSGSETHRSDEQALAALGPRIATTGIPAVLAMQGNITMESARRFLPVLFSELQRDGQIDRAVAVARGAIRDRADWWMPVLFLHLGNGQLWK